MRSTQDKILKAIETAATDYGFEVVRNSGYANTGTVNIEDPDGFEPVLQFYYRFNEPYYQIDNILPHLPELKQPAEGKNQDVTVWLNDVYKTGGTSAEVIGAIRNHLARARQALNEKEIA